MSNYTSVTMMDGKTEVSNSGGSHSQLTAPEDPNNGKDRDRRDAMQTPGIKQSVIISGNEMQYSESSVMRSTPPTEGALAGTLSTLKTPDGRPINDMTQVKPTSLIEIGGTQVEVRTAVGLGYMIRDGQGNYRMVGEDHLKPGSAQEARKSQAEAQKANQEVVNFKTENDNQVMDLLRERAGSRATDSLIVECLSAAVTGRPANAALDAFCQDAGVDPAKTHQWLNQYANNLLDNGLKYAGKRYGINPDLLMKYLDDKCSPRYKASLLHALHLNNLKAGDELVQFYKEARRIF